ncbi:MAG TPA: hypothetical protein VFI86_08555 [Burkholderiales bacterium]|nr:hypothetical protein [Burkholderiales bacterium]
MNAVRPRFILRVLCATILSTSAVALAQSGLRLSQRDEPGLDPALAPGWLVPAYDRFGFASQPWRDGFGFASPRRMQWSYDLTRRASVSMSYVNLNGSESDFYARPLSLFGRYWFSSDWALSAESMSRDATGLLRLQDFRIGVQRSF